MDYTTQTLGLKLRKALRYVRLYGVRRTLVKVRGARHMRRRFAALPALPTPVPRGGHVGLIGCGNFAYTTLAYFIHRRDGGALRAAMDIDLHRAASLWRDYRLRYYTDDAERIFGDPAIDLVFVASDHASHADYAVRALESGQSVHVEKPHVVTREQLVRLCRALRDARGGVALGFNRPLSRFTRLVREHLASQSGPAVYNWAIIGHAIPADHWYARPEQGGRVFGNLCHWTDFLYQLVPAERRHPIRVVPARGAAADCDIALSLVFGDGTVAAITFSAQGHAFEGVRESLTAQRGDVALWLRDFQHLSVERAERRWRYRARHRDHGHEARVRASCALAGAPGATARDLAYVWETGELFIAADEALRRDEPVLVPAFDAAVLDRARMPSAR